MFGNPNYEFSSKIPGEIPRALSLHRTSYTLVASTKQPFPVVWFAVDAPASSVFVPFFADALRGEGKYSRRYGAQSGPKLQAFDRESAFWAFDFVANWMGLNYRNMSLEVVYPKKAELQWWVLEKAAQAEVRAAQPGGDGPADVLGQAQTDIQEHVAVTWWALADTLITRYNDGNYNFPDSHPESVFGFPFPEVWLRMIGYNGDFYRAAMHWVQPADQNVYLVRTAD
jgi:dipeptidase